ncbi:MAG: hypothetical protein ABIW50_04040, partial [Candidatus Limnocylindria bacterium]
ELEELLASAGGEVLTRDASVWRARLTAEPDAINRALEALRGQGLRRLVRAGAVAMAADSPTTTENGATPE